MAFQFSQSVYEYHCSEICLPSAFQAAEAKNIPVLLEALANKANVDWRNSSDGNKTALIRAVESVSLLATANFYPAACL